MNLSEELAELRLEQQLLNSFCLQTEVGIEAIDPKSFLKQLKRMTEKSSYLVKKILGTADVQIEAVPKRDFALTSNVLKKPFTIVGDNVVYIPVGFVGQLSEFIKFLFENKDNMKRTNTVLNDANGIFSLYLSKPNELMNVDAKSIPNMVGVDKLPNEFREFFLGQEGNDRAPMHEVYKSYSDYNVVSEYLEKLTRFFSKVSLDEVNQSVDDFFETLNMLTTYIDEGTAEVSKQTAKAIGDLIYRLADWVAIYSLYLTKLISVTNAHRDTAEKLNDLVK